MANPTDTPALVSMAQQFTGLPMESLIGAPLKAAAEANNMMAITTTQFLMDTCFKKPDKEGGNYEPIIINMKLTRAVVQPGVATTSDPNPAPTVEQITSTFTLPLLTILPLNSLAVESASVEFDMEVKSSYSDETSENTKKEFAGSGSFEAKIGWGIFSATVKGSVSYKSDSSTSHSTHYQKSNSAQYSVKVNAGQLPLPNGVNTIIQAYTNSISPVELPAPTTATPAAPAKKGT